jgi:hypothetical protein
MDPVAKKMLNSLSCPICKSPIDMAGYYVNNYNYGCATDIDHYAIHLILWEPIIRISGERVNLYDKNRKYSLIKSFDNGNVVTTIEIYETDLENRVIFSFKDKRIMMNKDLFDFRNFNAEKALNRIKTIFVFQ